MRYGTAELLSQLLFLLITSSKVKRLPWEAFRERLALCMQLLHMACPSALDGASCKHCC